MIFNFSFIHCKQKIKEADFIEHCAEKIKIPNEKNKTLTGVKSSKLPVNQSSKQNRIVTCVNRLKTPFNKPIENRRAKSRPDDTGVSGSKVTTEQLDWK